MSTIAELSPMKNRNVRLALSFPSWSMNMPLVLCVWTNYASEGIKMIRGRNSFY